MEVEVVLLRLSVRPIWRNVPRDESISTNPPPTNRMPAVDRQASRGVLRTLTRTSGPSPMARPYLTGEPVGHGAEQQ